MFQLCLALFLTINVFAARTTDERKALFQESTKRLKESGIEKKSPQVGEQFPNLMLEGKKVDEWLKKGNLVVTFYRGGWCPYCIKQLKELNASLTAIKNAKSNLIAISPEQKLQVIKTKKKNNLEFVLLSDSGNQLARKLGLVYKVDREVVDEYKALGIDLETSQGNKSFELPMPATFVINKERKIIFAFSDADYTKRASVADIMKEISVQNEN